MVHLVTPVGSGRGSTVHGGSSRASAGLDPVSTAPWGLGHVDPGGQQGTRPLSWLQQPRVGAIPQRGAGRALV